MSDYKDLSYLPEYFDQTAERLRRAVWRHLAPLLRDAPYEGESKDILGRTWSVAMPVALERGRAMSDDANYVATQPLTLDLPGDVTSLATGTRLRFHGGTRGHMFWPPETAVFLVLDGTLEGRSVEFVIDSDPRMAGALGAVCGPLLVRAEEPLFDDKGALDLFAADVRSLLAATYATT